MRRDVFMLRLTLDSAYPGIAHEARDAISVLLLPRNRASVAARRGTRVLVVSSWSKAWPELLPQHGTGRKHERRIGLAPWQLAITTRWPEPFVRGLIHSDGCRYIARQRRRGLVYSYPRYAFKNRSRDIIRLLCDHLNLLGVGWTEPGVDQVQVARAASVARLDAFVGPKS
jgi:hypothetical protein